ncbi:MAG TPA: metallophosphoesterase [Cellulomonas sp.]
MTSADDHLAPDDRPEQPAPGRSGVLARLQGRRPGRPKPPPGVRRRRWGRWLGLGLVALLVSLVIGVTNAAAESSLGPHEARYEVTTDSSVTVDLGPFGTLVIDSPLPLALGVRVTVQEIPEDVDALEDIDTLTALSSDLQSYLQFFAAPQSTIQDAARALVLDALARTGVMLLVLLAAGWAARALLGPARRREILAAVTAHRREAVAATMVVLLVGAGVTASQAGAAAGRAQVGQATAVFDGTPLEGARITGRLGGIIDTYGALVVRAYRENEEFYRGADEALVAAWDAWQAQQPAAQDATVTDEATALADAGSASATSGASAQDGTSAAASDQATAAATSTSDATAPAAEPVTLLVISDLHCNVGMAPLITSMVELSGAQVVLDAGDTTMNGTSVEQYCVSTIARAVPDGVDLVTAAGNHDSEQTTAQYADAGAIVLDGGVVEVQGLRILGDSDPKASRLTEATQQDESYADLGTRLSDVACSDPDGVDLVLFHNPRAATTLLADGCVPAMVSGHMHVRTDPEQIGEGIRYTSSSTAGAVENEPRIGPLNGTAEMTVLRWDPTTRQVLDWQLIEIGTDGSATVHDRVQWPAVEPTTDDAGSTDGATGTPTGTTTTQPAG